jgi:tetrahydromethanopterin S-methyltransferase subunit D
MNRFSKIAGVTILAGALATALTPSWAAPMSSAPLKSNDHGGVTQARFVGHGFGGHGFHGRGFFPGAVVGGIAAGIAGAAIADSAYCGPYGPYGYGYCPGYYGYGPYPYYGPGW